MNWICRNAQSCTADGCTAREEIKKLRAEVEWMKDAKPVAWINDKLPHMTVRIKPHEGGNWVPVYLHPAPIPSTHVLVPNALRTQGVER